jgi:electron transport complex protein RnfD
MNVDATTGATPLGLIKHAMKTGENVSELIKELPNYAQLLIGERGGSLGEVAALAIIFGGIILLIRKVITWHIPVTFIGTVFVFASVLHCINPNLYISPEFHILAGGLLLGAIFMATDMVTSPMASWGKIVFGIGCGLLTMLIRVWGSYPEGVSFAILIMNAFVPLINKGFKPKRFRKKGIKIN